MFLGHCDIRYLFWSILDELRWFTPQTLCIWMVRSPAGMWLDGVAMLVWIVDVFHIVFGSICFHSIRYLLGRVYDGGR